MRPAVIVIALATVLASSSGQAQPRIARESLPAAVRPEVERQIDELFAADAVRRASGACELSRLRGAAAPAIPFLVSLLADDVPTPMVRCRLERQMGAWALDFEGRDVDLSQWPPTSPAREAARALEAFGDRALGAVLAATTDPVFTVRKYVSWILGRIDDDRAVSALMRLLRDDSPRVRVAAAQGLGRHEDGAAVYPLVGVLWDRDAEVREAAAWALGRLEDPAAVEWLVHALRDPDKNVRRQAAWALGRIGGTAAGSALIEAVDDADLDLRRLAISALAGAVDPNPNPNPRAELP